MTFKPDYSGGNYTPESITLPSEKDELYPILKRVLEGHARLLNRKDTAQYEKVEVQCNGQYFSGNPNTKRFVFRKVVELGTLSTGVNTVAHGITTNPDFVFTHVYGSIYNQATPLWVPIPNDGILVTVDGTNVNITIPAAYNFYSGLIVLEFIKN